MARELKVYLSDGLTITVSKEHEQLLHDAITKSTPAVTLRDNTGGTNLVNVSHIVRVEMRP